MKITDLLSVNAVNLNVSAADKNDVLNQAVDLMVAQGNILNRDTYLQAVLTREEERPIVVYQNAGTGKIFTQYICQKQILCNICLPVPAFVCSS